jgi:tRNA threonylcarbamoyladenosine biosynthesis protein TsaE
VKKIKTHNPEETEAVGEKLARDLRSGDVVGLYGGLGAGKTCLVRGLARGLESSGPVSSPTFTLLNEYPGRLPLYHFDLYRIATPVEVEDLGFEEYIAGPGVCVVEWAEKAGILLPTGHWKIKFEIRGKKSRTITIIPPLGA